MRPKEFPFHFLTYSLWGTFALTLFSGVFLVFYYVPTFSQAFTSVQKINDQVPFGWIVRRVHAAGGGFLLLLFLIHLLRVFIVGDYKAQRSSKWVCEVLLVVFAAWANFTGFFLPLSQQSFWGTAATLSAFSTLPWIGSSFAEFLRGGRELGGMALTRFFSMHMGFAALIAVLLFSQSRRVECCNEEGRESLRTSNLWAWSMVSLSLFAVIIFRPHWFTDPLREAANPTSNPESISTPWFFLFLQEAVSYFYSAYPVLSVLLLIFVLVLLFGLPYFDRSPARNLLQRPVSLSVVSALVIVVVYFTLLGMAGAHYGEKVIIPKNNLTAEEVRGAQVFAQKNCAYCHQVLGHEGRREGPDMSVVRQRNRSPEWVQRFILNARLYQPGTTMPRYEIPLEDLEALRAYLLSLDPAKRSFLAVSREPLLKFGVPADFAERK